MLRIPSLVLPETLPCAEAIKSCGDSPIHYEADFWEFDYQTYRYLARVSDSQLARRYQDLLQNMSMLISRDRDVIPIQSFLSSWYWFRKEHQTRLEFSLRGIPPPVLPPLNVEFDNKAVDAPIRPKHPNAGDVLYRYDSHNVESNHVQAMVQKGIVRIRPASDFGRVEQDKARQDEEQSKDSFLPGAYTRVTTQDGRNLSIIGDIKRTVSTPDYYVFCMTCDWDRNLFSAFNADCCVVIKDGEDFARRLESATSSLLPGWYFHHNPVQYFDPYEMRENEYFKATMSKDFQFAYQREYRFLWDPLHGGKPDGFKFLNLGCLEDLTEIHF